MMRRFGFVKDLKGFGRNGFDELSTGLNHLVTNFCLLCMKQENGLDSVLIFFSEWNCPFRQFILRFYWLIWCEYHTLWILFCVDCVLWPLSVRDPLNIVIQSSTRVWPCCKVGLLFTATLAGFISQIGMLFTWWIYSFNCLFAVLY